MNQDRANNRKRSGWIAAWIILLPVLYVASFGPAMWWGDKVLPSETLWRAYRPLIWAAVWHDEDMASAVLRWYAYLGIENKGNWPAAFWNEWWYVTTGNRGNSI